jgi:AcrR family transcriptional regulator
MSQTTSRQGRRYRGASAVHRQELRREKLLSAALELIGGQGLKAATVRAVCARAELTQRYYYESFENAEDLLIAVYEQQWQLLAESLHAAIEGAPKNPVAIAQAALFAVFSHLRRHPHGARVLFLEVLGVSARVDRSYRQGSQRMIELVVAQATPLLPQPAVEGLDAQLQGGAVVGAVIFVAMNWILADYATPEEVLVDNLMVLARSVIEGLQVGSATA